MQKITKPQKALRHHLFFALFAMLMAGLAWAGPKEDIKAAYERKDYKLVVKVVNPLAIEGEAWAQRGLADAYILGQGVVQDYAEAAKWYRFAAQQGDESAQLNLGNLYSKGQGVVQDYVKAHSWYQLSTVNGFTGAVKNRDIVAKQMTPQQIGDAQKLALDCQARQFKGCD